MRGFSTLELLIALMVIASALVALTIMAYGTPAMITAALQQRGATEHASMLLEREQQIAKKDASAVASISTTTDGIYDSSLTVSTLSDELTKKLESRVAWTDVHGIRQTITLVALVTDFTNADGQSCAGVPSGDWQLPIAHSYFFSIGDILPGSLRIATSSIAAIAASGNLLITGAASLAHAGDPDLFIFSTTNDSRPSLDASYATSSTTAGIAALAATRSYLYVASASACTAGPSCGQLQILDIRDPAHPIPAGHLLLSTTTQAVAAKSIFYKNGLVYLGLMKTSDAGDAAKGSEFNVIDVRDPGAPKLLGGYPVTRTVNAIRIAQKNAYLATDDRGDADVLILDVHDPAAIIRISSYAAPPESNTAAGFAHAIALIDTRLYVGRTTIRNGDELVTLDGSTHSPYAIASADTGTSIEGLVAQGSLLFSLASHELDLWNISDLHSLTPYTDPISLPTPESSKNTAAALACSGNVVYIGSNAGDGTGAITVVHGSYSQKQ